MHNLLTFSLIFQSLLLRAFRAFSSFSSFFELFKLFRALQALLSSSLFFELYVHSAPFEFSKGDTCAQPFNLWTPILHLTIFKSTYWVFTIQFYRKIPLVDTDSSAIYNFKHLKVCTMKITKLKVINRYLKQDLFLILHIFSFLYRRNVSAY